MIKLLAATGSAALLLGSSLLLPAPAQAVTVGPAPVIDTTVVDDGPGQQTDPHIDGALVTYTSDVDGTSEVRHRNLTTGATGAIPETEQDLLSDVSGTVIVFTRFFLDGHSAVVAYDTSTGVLTELDPQPTSQRQNPAIGGDTVAWEDYGQSVPGGPSPQAAEIVVYDSATGETTHLTDDLLLDVDPAVSPDGSVVVWSKCALTRTECQIWQAVRTGTEWVTSPVTTSAVNARLPDTNGTVVTYQDAPDGDLDIFWRLVAGGAEQRLALPGIQRIPNISGNLISFESQDAPGANFDLFVYDLTTDTLYRVTATPGTNEQLNDISVTADGLVRIVWSARGVNGDFNVFAASFRLPASAPTTKEDCDNGGWQRFTNPTFKSHGECVSWVSRQRSRR